MCSLCSSVKKIWVFEVCKYYILFWCFTERANFSGMYLWFEVPSWSYQVWAEGAANFKFTNLIWECPWRAHRKERTSGFPQLSLWIVASKKTCQNCFYLFSMLSSTLSIAFHIFAQLLSAQLENDKVVINIK